MPLVPGRRRAFRRCASGIGVAVLLLATQTIQSVALNAPAATSTNHFRLVSQSNDVIGSATFSMTLATKPAAGAAPEAIEVSVYPKLLNRTEFNSTIGPDTVPSSTCLTQTPDLEVPAATGTRKDHRTTLRLKVLEGAPAAGCTTSATTLSLTCSPGQCAGVYPVRVRLVDTTTNTTLQAFTTHLIELDSKTIADRLSVGVVLSLGSTFDLSPTGHSTLSAGQLVSLTATLNAISSHRGVHLSIALYPQLLVALERTTPRPTAVINQLETLLRRRSPHQMIELLDTPFASLNTSALAGANESATFSDLQSLGATIWSQFGLPPRDTSYLAPGELTSGGEAVLSSSCLNSLILQPSTPVSSASGLTQTAPVEVPTTEVPTTEQCANPAIANSTTSAFIADSSAATLSSTATTTVLAAHHFLAALAQIYFEQPNLAGRDLVVTPSESISTEVLNELLGELGSSPLISSQTLTALSTTTSIGSNGNTVAIVLPTTARGANALPKKAIAAATRAQRVLASLVPTNAALLTETRQDVEFGESTGLSPSARRHLIGAAGDRIRSIAKSLSFLGTSNFTLTSAEGKIPISINQNGNSGPINIRILLQSGGLILPNGGTKSITLKANATSLANVQVETRSSGNTLLNVSVLTPFGGHVLITRVFTVRSTAISVPAVILSVLALGVLAIWWIRSSKRKRRHHRHADPPETVQ